MCISTCRGNGFVDRKQAPYMVSVFLALLSVYSTVGTGNTEAATGQAMQPVGVLQECGGCHGTAENPSPNGAQYPNQTGSHPKHFGLDCVLCHNTPEGPGGADHFLPWVAPADVIFATSSPLVGTNAAFDGTAKSCSNVYCHDPMGNAQPGLLPHWGMPDSVSCGSCHPVSKKSREDLNKDGTIEPNDLRLFGTDWDTAAGGDASKPDFNNDGAVDTKDLLRLVWFWHTAGGARLSSATHTIHFSTMPLTGLNNCLTCHPDSFTTHSPVDGMIAFKDGLGLEQTATCGQCHGENHSLCLDCHNAAIAGRRAVSDDFAMLSHHVAGEVTNQQCLVCHDQSEHTAGVIHLKNYNSPSTPISVTSNADIEPFCLGCHDADGAEGNLDPFADGGSPVDIAGTWSGAAHKAAGDLTCIGDGTTGCHAGGHGSMKHNLLAPGDVPATAPGLTEEEEGFCYHCHRSGGIAPDIQSEFARTSRHDVAFADQSAHGSKVECINCHSPHASNLGAPLVDPDDTSALWTGDVAGFCLKCHDGAPPEEVIFPIDSSGSGYDKSAWIGSKHQTTGMVGCMDCHERHGSDEASMKSLQYDQIDPSDYTHGSSQYALCWQCHSEDKVVRTSGGTSAQNAFGTNHNRHVRSESAACIMCHNVHSPYDAGEDGLMSYWYPVIHAWDFSLSSETLSSSFRDTGTNTGSCHLTCHGKSHSGLSYTGTEAGTLK